MGRVRAEPLSTGRQTRDVVEDYSPRLSSAHGIRCEEEGKKVLSQGMILFSVYLDYSEVRLPGTSNNHRGHTTQSS